MINVKENILKVCYLKIWHLSTQEKTLILSVLLVHHINYKFNFFFKTQKI